MDPAAAGSSSEWIRDSKGDSKKPAKGHGKQAAQKSGPDGLAVLKLMRKRNKASAEFIDAGVPFVKRRKKKRD